MRPDFRGLRRKLRDRMASGDELAHNRALILAENCTNSVQANLVGGNFFTGLLLLLNASTLQIGMVNILTYVCNTLQLLSPLILERYASRKKLLIFSRIVIHVLNIVMIGLVGILPVAERLRVTLILGLIALLNAVSALTSPGFSVWHIQSIPDRERANYFSANQRLVNFAVYILILVGGLFIDRFKAMDREMLGFLILRGVAVLFAVWDICLLARIKEYEYPKSNPPTVKSLFTEPFHAKLYMLSVLIGFLWNFFATTTGSYYSVYMLQHLQVSYSFLNLVSALYVPVVLFLAPVWARYINRTSWLSVFWKALLFYGVFYCGHSFVNADCLWLYPVVVIFCFLLSPAINLVMANIAYYNIPEKNQTIYLSFYSFCSMIGAILGNLFATQFMLHTEGRTFRMFGVPMISNQFLPTITGLLIIALGVIVFFLDRREIRLKKEAPPEEEPF